MHRCKLEIYVIFADNIELPRLTKSKNKRKEKETIVVWSKFKKLALEWVGLRYLLMKVPLVEKYLLTQESEKHSHQQRTTWQWTFAFPYTQALLAAQDFGVDVNVGDSAGMVLVLLSLPMSTRWLSTCLTNESRQVGTDTAPGMP